MIKSPVVIFFQVISFIGSVVGIIFFFINPVVTIVCGAISLVNSFVQTIWGDQNNLWTEIATIIVASVVTIFTDLNWLDFTAFILCAAEMLSLIIGWIVATVVSNKANKYQNNNSFASFYEASPVGEEIKRIDDTLMELQISYKKATSILDNYSEEDVLEMYNNGKLTASEKEEYLYHIESAKAFVITIPEKIKELQHQRFELLNRDE